MLLQDSVKQAETSGRDTKLEAAIQLKTSEVSVLKKKFPKWSELAEKARLLAGCLTYIFILA